MSHREDFTGRTFQDVTVTFKTIDGVAFDPEDLEGRIADATMLSLEGSEFDSGEEYEIIEPIGEPAPDGTYTMTMRIEETVGGTCMYTPGRYYGPPENCYPDDIDDVEFEYGYASDCNMYDLRGLLQSTVVDVDTLHVNIDDFDEDFDMEFEESYPDWL